MKTFEIFLLNGTVARITAAKVETTLSLTLNTQRALVFKDEAGAIIAEFNSEAVAGLLQPPVPKMMMS